MPPRRGALVPLLSTVAAALLAWPVRAQEAAPATELVLPEITVTTEDPLILLPPLGPLVAASPVPLPAPASARGVARETPVATVAGNPAPPAPVVVAQTARAPDAVERSSHLTLSAALDDLVSPQAVRTRALLEAGDQERQVMLDLTGTVPRSVERPVLVAARSRLGAPGRQLAVDFLLVTAAAGQGLRAGLSAEGPVATALTYARWRTGSSASLTARLGLGQLLSGLDVSIGGAVTLEAGGVFPLPAAQVTFAPAAAWQIAAGVRPYNALPRWLADAVASTTDFLDLTPQRAWLAWASARYADLELRFGVAHGLIHEIRGESVAPVAEGPVVFQLVAESAAVLHRGRTGDATLRLGVGAAGTWPEVRARLLLEAALPFLTAPPVAALLQAGFLQAPLYGVEEWLVTSPARLGLSVAAGVRWDPAHGHQVQLLGGVRHQPAKPQLGLTPFVGIEYARRVVRLVAPAAR